MEVADLFQTVQKVQEVMEKVHNTESSTIVVQDGPDAGQTILVRKNYNLILIYQLLV